MAAPARRRQHPPKGGNPSALGYRMPAEWEPQESVWFSWPHDPLTFPDRLDRAEDAFERMVRAVARHQHVDLLVDPGDEEERVRARFAGLANVRYHAVRHVDSWIRDYGPTFLVRDTDRGRERAWVDWIFNAWGDKYDTLLADDAVTATLDGILGLPRFEPGIVMEGGAIDVNGTGSVLTTEQCLLNPNRNPHLSRDEVEQYLRDYLGVTNVLWLGDGIVGDDTDGHVDDVARFVGPRTVLAAVEEDPASPNHAPLAENLRRLKAMTNERGEPLEVVPVPMPEPLTSDEGDPLPASYLNFLITNRTVLLPVFGEARDETAERLLALAFPDREVVPIPAVDLVWGNGTVHCLSQQMPAG